MNPEPAPAGFEFDPDKLLLVAAQALRTAGDEDLYEGLRDDRLSVVGELDAESVPFATVIDNETGKPLARMGLHWRAVARDDAIGP